MQNKHAGTFINFRVISEQASTLFCTVFIYFLISKLQILVQKNINSFKKMLLFAKYSHFENIPMCKTNHKNKVDFCTSKSAIFKWSFSKARVNAFRPFCKLSNIILNLLDFFKSSSTTFKWPFLQAKWNAVYNGVQLKRDASK